MESLSVRPGQAPALAQAGLAIATSKAHIAVLLAMQNEIRAAHLQESLLPEAMVTCFERFRKRHGWRWSTTARNMGTAIGALAHLPMYSDAPEHMAIMTHPVWREALKAVEREATTNVPARPRQRRRRR